MLRVLFEHFKTVYGALVVPGPVVWNDLGVRDPHSDQWHNSAGF